MELPYRNITPTTNLRSPVGLSHNNQTKSPVGLSLSTTVNCQIVYNPSNGVTKCFCPAKLLFSDVAVFPDLSSYHGERNIILTNRNKTHVAVLSFKLLIYQIRVLLWRYQPSFMYTLWFCTCTISDFFIGCKHTHTHTHTHTHECCTSTWTCGLLDDV